MTIRFIGVLWAAPLGVTHANGALSQAPPSQRASNEVLPLRRAPQEVASINSRQEIANRNIGMAESRYRQANCVVGLSRFTRWINVLNLGASLAALLVFATILGLGIGTAVTLHIRSTLLVASDVLTFPAYRDVAS